jgi:endogenous inhibitor of DNA gyrase (YacG/DUF329 family)
MTDKLVPFPDRRSRRRKCPICGRPPQSGSEPFCSQRCRDEDLSRWLIGGYRLPTNEPSDPDANDPESGRN